MNASYLPEFLFFVFSVLPFIAMALGGQGAKLKKLVPFTLFGFGLSGGVTALYYYEQINNSYVEMSFLIVCVLSTLTGYFWLKSIVK
jgi:hypothetical protein